MATPTPPQKKQPHPIFGLLFIVVVVGTIWVFATGIGGSNSSATGSPSSDTSISTDSSASDPSYTDTQPTVPPPPTPGPDYDGKAKGGWDGYHFLVRVLGSQDEFYTGDIDATGGNGTSAQSSVTGMTGDTYKPYGCIVSVTFQKSGDDAGLLRVQILGGGKVLQDVQTSAPYGVASASVNGTADAGC